MLYVRVVYADVGRCQLIGMFPSTARDRRIA